MMGGKRINPLCQRHDISLSPAKNSQTKCTSPFAGFNYQLLYQIRKRLCSKGCSFQLLSCQIPKEISFIWTMHFFLFKKRKKINIWFQYEGTGINIANLWVFSPLAFPLLARKQKQWNMVMTGSGMAQLIEPMIRFLCYNHPSALLY